MIFYRISHTERNTAKSYDWLELLIINNINAITAQQPMKPLYFVPILAVLCLVPVGFISAQTDSIPSWIRNNAGLWADGLIGDETFLAGIEFLIENGIITVGDPATSELQQTIQEKDRQIQELRERIHSASLKSAQTIQELKAENQRLRNESQPPQTPTSQTHNNQYSTSRIYNDFVDWDITHPKTWSMKKITEDEYHLVHNRNSFSGILFYFYSTPHWTDIELAAPTYRHTMENILGYDAYIEEDWIESPNGKAVQFQGQNNEQAMLTGIVQTPKVSFVTVATSDDVQLWKEIDTILENLLDQMIA